MNQSKDFNQELLKDYPKSNKKIQIEVDNYSISEGEEQASDDRCKAYTTYISPDGLEFHGSKIYPEGSLLKIMINLPDYWPRKKKLVGYSRIDTPKNFKILAKVTETFEIGKRRKKKGVIAKVVNIDEIDKEVLKTFLDESK